MASTLSSLVLDIAARDSILAARASLAPLGRFAHSFALTEDEKGNVVKVPVFSRGAAAEFGASLQGGGVNDYTSATTAGVGGVNITLNHHPWESKRLLPDDVMETDVGRDWASQTTIAAVDACAKFMQDAVMTDIVTNATGTALTISGANYLKKVAGIRKQAIAAGIKPQQSTLLVDPDFYSELLTELPADVYGARDALLDGWIDRILGFGRIAEVCGAPAVTISTGGSAKTYDFDAAVVPDDAYGLATRLPIVQNPDKFDVSDITMPEIGPWSFRVRSTGTNSNDAKFLGAEVIFGCACLQPTKILVAKTEVV